VLSAATVAAVQHFLGVASVQPCPGRIIWINHAAKRVPLMVDSGSSITLLRHDAAERLNLEIKPCPIQFSCANGLALNIKGCADFTFELLGNQVQHTCIVVDVQQVGYQGLLGLDFLQKYHAISDHSSHTLKFPWGTTTLEANTGTFTVESCQEVEQPSPSSPQPADTTISAVVLPHKSRINAGTLTEVTCFTTFPAGTEVLVLTEHHDIRCPAVPLTTVTKEKGEISFLVMNSEKQHHLLKPGTIEGIVAIQLGMEYVLAVEPLQEQRQDQEPALLVSYCNNENEEGPNHYPEPLCPPLTDEQRLAFFDFSKTRPDELTRVKTIISANFDAFAFPDKPIGCTTVLSHKIETGQHPPVRESSIRYSRALLPVIKKFIDSAESQGVIERGGGEWSAPLVMIAQRAPDGTIRKYRPCINWKGLNRVTKKRVYPLPHIQDILDGLSGCPFLSNLDLDSGYWQLPMDEASKEKTSFSTPFGQYQCLRMGFGLVNGPTDFITAMDIIYKDMERPGLQRYMDDLIAGTSELEAHYALLQEIFDRTKKANLQLKPSKCQFLVDKIYVLGHTVSNGISTPDMRKVDAIVKYPAPTDIKKLRCWLGMVNYYRRYIKGFSKITAPLTELTKETVPYIWEGRHQDAFATLNSALMSEPVLRLPEDGRTYVLSTDASNIAMGSVLEQEFDDGRHPIAFHSKKLNPAQRNYSTTDREILAAHFGITVNDVYLSRVKFILQVDHEPIMQMFKKGVHKGRSARISMDLSDYDFVTVPIPGAANQVADAMSRIEIDLVEPEVGPVEHLAQTAAATDKIWDRAAIKAAQETDHFCAGVINQLHALQHPQESLYFLDKDGLLYIKEAHSGRLCVPEKMIQRVLETHHDLPCGGHKGSYRMIYSVRRRFYWPGWIKAIKEYTTNCKSCIRVKGRPLKIGPPREPPPVLVRLQRISVDLVGPKSVTQRGNKYILTMIDDFSNYLEAVAIPDMKTTTVAMHFLDRIICRHGTPRQLHSDRGVQFTSKLLAAVCKLLKIKQIFTTPYHPQGNGKIERAHRTAGEFLVHFCCRGQGDWDLMLPFALMAHNSSPNRTTGQTPSMMMMIKEIEMPWESITYPEEAVNFDYDIAGLPADQFVQQMQARLAMVHSAAIESTGEKRDKLYSKEPLPTFRVGDVVLLREKRPYVSTKDEGRWRTEYVVTKQRCAVTYDIKMLDPVPGDRSHVYTSVHVSHLRPASSLTKMLIMEELCRQIRVPAAAPGGVQGENAPENAAQHEQQVEVAAEVPPAPPPPPPGDVQVDEGVVQPADNRRRSSRLLGLEAPHLELPECKPGRGRKKVSFQAPPMEAIAPPEPAQGPTDPPAAPPVSEECILDMGQVPAGEESLLEPPLIPQGQLQQKHPANQNELTSVAEQPTSTLPAAEVESEGHSTTNAAEQLLAAEVQPPETGETLQQSLLTIPEQVMAVGHTWDASDQHRTQGVVAGSSNSNHQRQFTWSPGYEFQRRSTNNQAPPARIFEGAGAPGQHYQDPAWAQTSTSLHPSNPFWTPY